MVGRRLWQAALNIQTILKLKNSITIVEVARIHVLCKLCCLHTNEAIARIRKTTDNTEA